jgi:hypothetical protein
MKRMYSKLLATCLVLLTGFIPGAEAFVLLGPGDAEGNPTKTWQNRGQNAGWNIGYDLTGDIGAPVDPLEFYRWNVPVITYAFEESFIRFFGTNGVKAVSEAFQILNDLPPVSRMSPDLSEFPLRTLRQNFEAAQFGLIDIKSTAMSFILEELGLAQPDRWVWALHRRVVLQGPNDPAVYDVVQYNIDPVTLRRSSYVNETLYTYEIIQVPPPGPLTPWSDAQEFPIPPDAIPNFAVASIGTTFTPGTFWTGLTRDDVGGLRYLWSPRNIVAETLLQGTVPGSAGGGWLPFIGTNFLGTNVVGTNIVVGTNTAVTAGLRGGVNKVLFRRVFFDSLLGGTFTPITNAYNDQVIVPATGRTVNQPVLRPIQLPDFIFTVEDSGSIPFAIFRTTTASWINNDLLTPNANLGGPGIIQPPVTIQYNLAFPIYRNQTPNFISEPVGPTFGAWATFDGTTNAPIIYPEYLHFTFGDLQNAARQQGGF